MLISKEILVLIFTGLSGTYASDQEVVIIGFHLRHAVLFFKGVFSSMIKMILSKADITVDHWKHTKNNIGLIL